jgi:hypothetical protein
MRDHAGGVARLARDPHNGGLVEAMFRYNPTRDERDLVAALLVIDNLGHCSS